MANKKVSVKNLKKNFGSLEVHNIIFSDICTQQSCILFLLFSTTNFDKKESRLRDSPLAAGRISDIFPYRRSAIYRGAFLLYRRRSFPHNKNRVWNTPDPERKEKI